MFACFNLKKKSALKKLKSMVMRIAFIYWNASIESTHFASRIQTTENQKKNFIPLQKRASNMSFVDVFYENFE